MQNYYWNIVLAFKVIVSVTHRCKLQALWTELKNDFKVYCNNYFDFFIFNSSIDANEVNIIHDIIYPELIPQNYDLIDKIVIFPCNGTNKSHLMHLYHDISDNFGIIFDYPLITYEGENYLYHCLDTDSHAELLHFFETHYKYTIKSILEYPIEQYYQNYMFSLTDLAKSITNREQEIISEAYFNGYYKIPREITSQDIATKKGTSRYNIDKIIRNAERKIMEFIHPFLI